MQEPKTKGRLQFGNAEHVALARIRNGEECSGIKSVNKAINDGYIYYEVEAIGLGVWRNNEFLQQADGDEYEQSEYDVDLVVRTFEYLQGDKEFDFRTPLEDVIFNQPTNQ